MHNTPQPKTVRQVMISSTFTDLKDHRRALTEIIKGNQLSNNNMENNSGLPGLDMIESSLQMVRDSHAYVGLISMKYGQVPDDIQRNPDKLSITELEFREALALKRPILLFIMNEDHLVKAVDVEKDPVNRQKLDEFRERAKKISLESNVYRIYYEFASIEEFKHKAGLAISGLRKLFDEEDRNLDKRVSSATSALTKANGEKITIPKPPALYAKPRYIGSHKFIGRRDQLETLNEWAMPSDPYPILLFEAIGGSGKSILTWEWITKHAVKVRPDWAGFFWYSFYEGGATMTDFCRQALAYIGNVPLENLKEKKTSEMVDELIQQLSLKPWLLVLDGLERILVSYHRFDAAHMLDEEAGIKDMIIDRDPCAAIRLEDEELLRALAGLNLSKILISSRLVPRILLNTSNQPIPGVKRIPLEGLKAADAEAMIRACKVAGDSNAIQKYLKINCDCHPLVIGILAGLINKYLPDRGNFDA